MKKFLRLFICLLTFVAGVGMAVANPAINVVNAIESMSTGVHNVANAKGTFAFTIDKMASEVDADEEEKMYIPFPKVSDTGAQVTVNVSNGKVTLKYRIDHDADSAKFTKSADGKGVYFNYSSATTYTVYFTAERDDFTYSSSKHYVEVKGATASFDYDSLKTSMPTVMGVGDKILIPTLDVKKGGSTVESDTTVTVIKNSVGLSVGGSELKKEDGKLYLTPESVGTYTIRYKNEEHNLSYDYDVTVDEEFDSSKVKFDIKTLSLKSQEVGEEVTFAKPEVADTYNGYDKVPVSVKITITDKDKNEVATLENSYKYTFTKTGTYTVKYEISNYYLNDVKTETVYLNGEDGLVVSDTKSAVVSFATDYDTTADEWEDNVSLLGDWAVKSVVGYDEIYVPALYASDLCASYDDMKTSFKRILKSNSNEIYDIDAKKSDVEDSSNSYLYNSALSSDYTKDVTKGVAFKFPRKEGESDADYINRIKGTYTLIYEANDGKRTTQKSVQIKVLGVDARVTNEDTHLSISLPTITGEMKSNETKEIKLNLATDDEDDRIETHYYYYYGTLSDFEDAYHNYQIEAEYKTNFVDFKATAGLELKELTVEGVGTTNSKAGKINLSLENYEGASNVTLVAVAINDQNHFVYDAKQIKIKNATADNEAPSIDGVESEFRNEYDDPKDIFVLGEDTLVNLPSVRFHDNIDEDLSVSVKYYIDTPENMHTVNSVSSEYREGDNHYVTVTGSAINLSKAGMYYVVYTAKDDSNNVCEYITCFEVKKQTNYAIKVSCDSNLDIYDSMDIIATIVDDEGNTIDQKAKVKFTKGAPTIEGETYTFEEAGDYTFYAYANVEGKYIESARYTIKVSDVEYKWDNEDTITAPTSSELSPSNEYEKLTSQPSDWTDGYANYYKYQDGDYIALEEATEFVSDTYYKKNELVYIQLTVPTASKNGRPELANVEITDPGNNVVEYVNVEDGDEEECRIKFLASKEGKYTIKYTVGSGDSKITKTLYTTVGDKNAPKVGIADTKNLQKDIVYTGDTITYSINYSLNNAKSNSQQNVYVITVSAKTESKTLCSYETSLTLYDIDRVGNKVALTWENAFKTENITLNGDSCSSVSNPSWTISSVGEYTLKIKAIDANSNESKEISIKFNVVDESSATEKKDNKTGVILIIISLVVLAGLICFFAFGGKTKNSNPKSNKSKKEEKVEEEKTQE